MSFSEGEFITSAAASELYEKYYAKDFSPSEFLAIVLEDPTTKSPRDSGNDGLESYEARKDDTKALQYLKKVTLGSYARQLLLWCRVYYVKSFTLHGGSIDVPKVLYHIWDCGAETIEQVASCLEEQGIYSLDEKDAENEVARVRNSNIFLTCFGLYGMYMKLLPAEYKSINKYRTIESFLRMLAVQVVNITISQYAEEMKKEVKVYCDTDRWFIFSPLTHRASRFFAGESSWCTANPDYDSNYYNKYTNNGTLYCVMDKSDKTNSVQMFVPDKDADRDYKFEAKDFKDHDLGYDQLQYYFGIIEDNTDLDISAMAEPPTPSYSYSVNFSFDDDSSYDEFSVEVSIALAEGITYDDDDMSFENGWYERYKGQLGLFDLSDADFSMISDAPEVNFSNPGMVLLLNDTDVVNIDSEFYSHCENYDGYHEDNSDFYEQIPGGQNSLLDDMSAAKAHGETTEGISYYFVVVLGDGGLDNPTELVNGMFDINPRYNGHPNSRIKFGYASRGASVVEMSDITYAGKHYESCYILYCTEDGDMETAMQKPWFADMMARGRPSSSPRQRETDKQLNLDLFKESIQRSRQRLAQIQSRRAE